MASNSDRWSQQLPKKKKKQRPELFFVRNLALDDHIKSRFLFVKHINQSSCAVILTTFSVAHQMKDIGYEIQDFTHNFVLEKKDIRTIICSPQYQQNMHAKIKKHLELMESWGIIIPYSWKLVVHKNNGNIVVTFGSDIRENDCIISAYILFIMGRDPRSGEQIYKMFHGNQKM